ncbi:MAG: 4Fe-4S binding protein [Thermodesulfobacteriota bacterium]
MKRKDNSAGILLERTSDPKTTQKLCEDTLFSCGEPGDVAINFHSAELNRIDDLNDCAGNYRSFQTLEGVLTAHERHQIERRFKGEALNPSIRGAARPKKEKVKNDEEEAFEAAASLTVISEGRTLMIDTDEGRALAYAKALRDHRLSCTLLITGGPLPKAPASRSGQIKALHVDRVSVTGAFGGFSAKVTAEGREKPLAEYLDDAAIFDLVLDLQPSPSFAGGRPPIGYYSVEPDSAAFNEAMTELPEMRGQFKKPLFVSFRKSLCFHGRSRTHDCRRCVEVCPVGAIQSADRKISVNHSLCQGCGGCSLICPAEAFRMMKPSQEELLNSLRSILETRPVGVVSPKSLVIFDSAFAPNHRPTGTDEPNRGRRIYFEVGEIAHVRLEVLLSSLVYGAEEVVVECGSQNPPAIREAVEGQVRLVRAILEGLGLEKERVRFLLVPAEDVEPHGQSPWYHNSPPSPKDGYLLRQGACTASGETSAKGSRVPSRRSPFAPSPTGETRGSRRRRMDLVQATPATQTKDAPGPAPFFSLDRGGRSLVYRTAQYLHKQSAVQQAWLPLPMGSPYGTVAVNSEACTLCMACVAACPSGALSSGGNGPRLVFQEFGCHQCGLCREKCPENAIQLIPRLFLGGTTESKSVLRETEPFRCVECGIPFAPPAMINRMREKLAGHWMYGNEQQLRRLQMCRTCRTRDALSSGEKGS